MSFTAVWRATIPLPVRDTVWRVRQRLFPGSAYYASGAEDAFMVAWFRALQCDPASIRYIDIGANHPIRLSNTYAFYRLGARGVLVEPDPDLAAELRRSRTGDTVISAGVAFDERSSATLFRLTARVYNTFIREEAERIVEASKAWPEEQRQSIVDAVTVPLISLNEIISEHLGNRPHLISIDTEGADLPILRSLDLSLLSNPCFICIENGTDAEVLTLLRPAGFGHVATTAANRLFMRRP